MIWSRFKQFRVGVFVFPQLWFQNFERYEKMLEIKVVAYGLSCNFCPLHIFDKSAHGGVI